MEKREETRSTFIAFETKNQVQVAAIRASLPMTGGLHMEINSGPLLPRGGYARTLSAKL